MSYPRRKLQSLLRRMGLPFPRCGFRDSFANDAQWPERQFQLHPVLRARHALRLLPSLHALLRDPEDGSKGELGLPRPCACLAESGGEDG